MNRGLLNWNLPELLPELSIRGAGQEDRSSGNENGSSVIIDFLSRMISDTLFRNIRIHNEREQDVMKFKNSYLYITKRMRGLEPRLSKYLTVKYIIIIIIIIIKKQKRLIKHQPFTYDVDVESWLK